MSVNLTQDEARNLDSTLAVEVTPVDGVFVNYSYYVADPENPNDGISVNVDFLIERDDTLTLAFAARVANDHPREEYNDRALSIGRLKTVEDFKKLVLENIVALA